MGVSLNSVGAITLFVEDLEHSKIVLPRRLRPAADLGGRRLCGVRFENTIVNLLTIPAARTLIEPGVVAGRDAGSRLQLSIWVDDAAAACAELEARGVALLNGPMDREWGMRTASFTDRAGNIWEIAQELSRG